MEQIPDALLYFIVSFTGILPGEDAACFSFFSLYAYLGKNNFFLQMEIFYLNHLILLLFCRTQNITI